MVPTTRSIDAVDRRGRVIGAAAREHVPAHHSMERISHNAHILTSVS